MMIDSNFRKYTKQSENNWSYAFYCGIAAVLHSAPVTTTDTNNTNIVQKNVTIEQLTTADMQRKKAVSQIFAIIIETIMRIGVMK